MTPRQASIALRTAGIAQMGWNVAVVLHEGLGFWAILFFILGFLAWRLGESVREYDRQQRQRR